MVACGVADRTREHGRRERPRRPSFVEYVGRVPLSEGPNTGERAEVVVPPSRPVEAHPKRPRAEAPDAPTLDRTTAWERADTGASATPPVFERARAVDPVVLTADDVNRPIVEPTLGEVAPLAARPLSPPTGGSSRTALWMAGGLAVGLAIGAIVGTVAALLVFG